MSTAATRTIPAPDDAAFRAGPVDGVSRERLAAVGLDVRSFDASSDAFPGWLQGVARGFLDGERTDEQIAAVRERSGHRRVTGVYDEASVLGDVPVGTVASWVSPLSVPGGAAVPASAVSAVTVAPTHRRRGIARALLESELRFARDAGLPLAMLTVSESTLYGRYGFAPAAAGATWKLDVKRASWIGPRPDGRLDFVPRERARELLQDLHARVRHGVPGEVGVTPGVWESFAGTRPDAEKAGERRAVQYADVDGTAQGVAVYSVRENHDDYTKSTVSLTYLVAATDDAYAALWRFFVEMDLIGELHAHLLSVDEPLLWMISDQRAATVTVTDHQYVRVIDVAAALEARLFGAPGTLVLQVDDVLGIADGRWLLTVDADGRGAVEPLDAGETPPGAVEVALGVEELSAAYLGGVSLATLAAAGRVTSTDAATAARVFSWHRAPRLSTWY